MTFRTKLLPAMFLGLICGSSALAKCPIKADLEDGIVFSYKRSNGDRINHLVKRYDADQTIRYPWIDKAQPGPTSAQMYYRGFFELSAALYPDDENPVISSFSPSPDQLIPFGEESHFKKISGSNDPEGVKSTRESSLSTSNEGDIVKLGRCKYNSITIHQVGTLAFDGGTTLQLGEKFIYIPELEYTVASDVPLKKLKVRRVTETDPKL